MIDEGGEFGARVARRLRAHIARIGLTPESFAQRYEVPVRIRLARLDGY